MSSSPNAIPDDLAHLVQADPNRKKPQRVITPRTRILLIIVLGLFSLLTANGLYLSGVTFAEWLTQQTYQNYFYQFMFLGHLVLGLLLVLPVIIFGFYHWKAAHNRRNRRAVKVGYALLAIAIAVLITGLLLMRIGSFDLKQPVARRIIYWAHVITPLAAAWMYWIHRLVGTSIKWYIGRRIAISTAVIVGAMIVLQMQDPRQWNQAAPKEGDKYFQPSLARTSTGNFIPEKALMNDEYCLKCHEDAYKGWFHSAHHFGSFNNPAYLYAVRETREVSKKRDGTVQAARWCAGCHDPVPFFTGAFDDPNYDDVNHSTSQAGISCMSCHAITHVGSTKGNAHYVIEETMQYPFTYSTNPWLQKINEILVKSKPSFHKQSMLKPFHKTAEFCSTCHKVHLPKELTAYKEFLRGQNHYDSYLLSGVSGHGAQSFYYPEKATDNCAKCHMPLVESKDFGAAKNDDTSRLTIHDHFFPGANTALPHWRGDTEYVERAKELLKGVTRIDIFGVREGGTIQGDLVAPLRPQVPTLKAGNHYLIETVVRTLKMGHHLTQGTVDSNELWIEVMVKSGDRVIGYSGGLDEKDDVDSWSHFLNVFMLDRYGNRISRRNAQDIFTPLYNHQIPPGAGQVAHYGIQIPEDVSAPIEIVAKLNYRKFDRGYIDFMNSAYKKGDNDFTGRETNKNTLPITVMCEDRVVLPVQLASGEVVQPKDPQPTEDKLPPTWQRWNDYGIGLLLTGKAQTRQALTAFEAVEKLNKPDGPINAARVLLLEGDLDGATAAIQRASAMETKPNPWTIAWLSGEVARQQGQLLEAEKNFREVLAAKIPERGFDFSFDFRIRNQLGQTLLDLAEQAEGRNEMDQSKAYLEQARDEFLQSLKVDTEDVTAHAALASIYQRLGDQEKSDFHGAAHLRYKPDDNAIDVAIPAARAQYPAANHAAEALVIYWLQRENAPRLPAEEARPPLQTPKVAAEPPPSISSIIGQ